ncbi:hypothetical protein B0H13DRAFT_2435245, partial [Mycena leptocephala]
SRSPDVSPGDVFTSISTADCAAILIFALLAAFAMTILALVVGRDEFPGPPPLIEMAFPIHVALVALTGLELVLVIVVIALQRHIEMCPSMAARRLPAAYSSSFNSRDPHVVRSGPLAFIALCLIIRSEPWQWRSSEENRTTGEIQCSWCCYAARCIYLYLSYCHDLPDPLHSMVREPRSRTMAFPSINERVVPLSVAHDGRSGTG